jgi:uncharacterized protein DUF1883
MNYLRFPLRYQNAHVMVEVTLHGVESDVFLMDSANLSSFERGAQCTYYGGHYKSSPVRLRIPSNGTWTAVVVPIGGSVRATARTITAA